MTVSKTVMVSLEGKDFERTESVHREAMAVLIPLFGTLLAFFTAVVTVGAAVFYVFGRFAESFEERLTPAVESGQVPALSFWLAAGSVFLFVAAFWAVRGFVESKARRFLDPAYAFNSLSRAVSGALPALDALAGPGGRALACFDCDRPLYRRPAHLTSIAFGALLALGAGLLISVAACESSGYAFVQPAALMLVMGLPVLAFAFAASYRVERSLAVMVFVAVFVVILGLLEGALPALFTFDSAFNGFLKVFYFASVAAFAWLFVTGGALRCLLLSKDGLRLVSISGGDVSCLSGDPIAPAKLIVSPSPSGARWTVLSSDAKRSLALVPTGADPSGFVEACRKAGFEVSLEGGPQKLSPLREIYHAPLNALLAFALVFFAVVFSQPLFSNVIYSGYIIGALPAVFSNEQGASARMERRCDVLLKLVPSDPIALAYRITALDPQNRFDEQERTLERQKAVAASFYLPVGRHFRELTKVYSRHVELMKKILAAPRAGFEPDGPDRAPFRIAMAEAVNVRRFFAGAGQYRHCAAAFADLIRSSPASPGPRVMLAWHFYKDPDSTIKNALNPYGATGEVEARGSLAAALGEKEAPGTREAEIYLKAVVAAHYRVRSELRECGEAWGALGDTIEGVLPMKARDRLLMGYLCAWLDKSDLSGWKPVFEMASGFSFAAEAPAPKLYALEPSTNECAIQGLLFRPPSGAGEFLAAFPEISKRLAAGEAAPKVAWPALAAMKEAELIEFYRGLPAVVGALPDGMRLKAENKGILK